MPLDELARRYANNLFQNSEVEILHKQEAELVKVRADHAKRGLVASSPHIAAQANLLLESIRLMGQARADSLLKAYEKAGMSLDEATFQEIKGEVMSFCHGQQHNAVGSIGGTIHQMFQGRTSPQLHESITQQICDGVTAIMNRLGRDLDIRRDEILLDDRKLRKVYAAGLGKQWDVFVCHASEDKESFVSGLATALRESGLSVWYDAFTLTVGDSLRRKIDDGLANSRYGIVVLSPNFFAKEWPQNELDGLMSREIEGNKVILPVWHNISYKEIASKSPMLSGRVAAKSGDGIDAVVSQLREAMGLNTT